MGNKEKAKVKQEDLKGTLIGIKQDLAGIEFNALSNNYGLISDMDFKPVCTAIMYINEATGGNLETEPEEVKKAHAVLVQINQNLMVSTECINKAIKETEKCLSRFKDKKRSQSRKVFMEFRKVLEATLNYLSVLNFISWAEGKHFYTILIKAYKKFTSAVLLLKALLVTATNNDSVGGENKKTLLSIIKYLETSLKLLHEKILQLALDFSNTTLASGDSYKSEEINKISKKITEANKIISDAIKACGTDPKHVSPVAAIDCAIGTLHELSPLLIDVSSNKKKGPIKRNFSKSNDFDLDFIKLISALEKFYNEPDQENLDNFKQLVGILGDRILRLPTKAAIFPLKGVLDGFLKTLSKLFAVMEIFMNTARSSEFSEVENTQNSDDSNIGANNNTGGRTDFTGGDEHGTSQPPADRQNRSTVKHHRRTRNNKKIQASLDPDSETYSYTDYDSSAPPNNKNKNKVKQKQYQGGASESLQPPDNKNSNLPRKSPTNKQNQNKVKPKKQINSQTSNDNYSDSSKRSHDNTDRQSENPVDTDDRNKLNEQISKITEKIRYVTRGMRENSYSTRDFLTGWQNSLGTVAVNVKQIAALIANSLPKKNKTKEEKNILSTLKKSYKSMQKLAQQKKANKKSFDGYYKKENKNYSKLEDYIQDLNENSVIFATQDSLLYFWTSVVEFIGTIRVYWDEIEKADNSRNNENNEKQKPDVKPSKKDVTRLINEARQTLNTGAEKLAQLIDKIQNQNYTLDTFARDWRNVHHFAEEQLGLAFRALNELIAAGGKSWKGLVGKFSTALEKRLSRSRNIVILLHELIKLTAGITKNYNLTLKDWNNYFKAVSNKIGSIKNSIESLEDSALLYPLREELNSFITAFNTLMVQMSNYWENTNFNIAIANQHHSESSSSGSPSSSPQNNSKHTEPDNPENNHNDSIEEEAEEISSHSASPRSNGKTQPAVGTETENTNAVENKPQNNDSIDTPLGNQLWYAIKNIQNNINMVQNPDFNFTQEVPLDQTRPACDFNNAANIVSPLDTIIGNMDDLLPKKKHRFSKEQDPSGHALMRQLRRLRDRIQKFCSISAPNCKQWQSFYESYQQIMEVLRGDAEALSDSSSLFQYRGIFMQLFNEIDQLMREINERWNEYINQHPEAASMAPPKAKKKFRFPWKKDSNARFCKADRKEQQEEAYFSDESAESENQPKKVKVKAKTGKMKTKSPTEKNKNNNNNDSSSGLSSFASSDTDFDNSKASYSKVELNFDE